jgi:hypothetical protein
MKTTLALALLGLLASATTAEATRFRRPYHPNVALNAGYDNNGGGGCTDYGCGGVCYNGHTGSDFNLGIGNAVLAGADGTVTQAVMGCPDIGYYCSPCGGNCGNHVRIAHDDGSSTLFCHMRDGSLTVGVGQRVGCGDKIGESASSGCSTGPHLHFGWSPPGLGARDPFDGGCSNRGGAWVDNGPYAGSPGPDCENRCECSPGEVQTSGCGRCGTHTRVCGGDCHWGGYSACEGEGPCAPGQTESQACCDCGSQTRVCAGNCQWDGFGACGGPDPAGSPPCPTGVPGDCATGALRCVEGCIACVQTVFPQPEVCDAHDNDCDGPTDEDATEMGDPPPPFAARLEDLSVPEALSPGEGARIWAVFRNVGTDPWPARDAWLGATVGEADAASPWRDPERWAAFDAPVSLTEEVPPGETATLLFPVRTPSLPEAGPTRFELVVNGAPVLCPLPGFDFAPLMLAAAQPVSDDADPDAGGFTESPDAPAEVDRTDAAPAKGGALKGTGASGCGISGAARGNGGALWLAPALALAALRRRRRARG